MGRRRKVLEVEVNGLRVRGVAVEGRSVRRVRKCVANMRGGEYCWEEHYLNIYLPQQLVPGEGEVILVVRVPRELVER